MTTFCEVLNCIHIVDTVKYVDFKGFAWASLKWWLEFLRDTEAVFCV